MILYNFYAVIIRHANFFALKNMSNITKSKTKFGFVLPFEKRIFITRWEPTSTLCDEGKRKSNVRIIKVNSIKIA